jgi:hypothetical protein
MSDERMQSALDEWFQDTDPQPPNARRTATRLMAQLPQTRQRGRWLPFRLFHPKAQTPTAPDTTEYQPNPIPASNGHTPTVIGRTQSMLSPVKAITAGAIVFAVGGAFLITQPFQQAVNVPGAEAEPIAPTWVTGNIEPASPCSSGDLVIDGDVRRYTNVECSPQTWTSSDPRLTGEVARRWSEDVYQTDEGTFAVSVDAPYLRNDGGDWACLDTSLLRGSGMSSESLTDTTFTCTGNGGYAGLSAVLVSTFTEGFNEKFVGLIFSGDIPPLPEPPAAE